MIIRAVKVHAHRRELNAFFHQLGVLIYAILIDLLAALGASVDADGLDVEDFHRLPFVVEGRMIHQKKTLYLMQLPTCHESGVMPSCDPDLRKQHENRTSQDKPQTLERGLYATRHQPCEPTQMGTSRVQAGKQVASGSARGKEMNDDYSRFWLPQVRGVDDSAGHARIGEETGVRELSQVLYRGSDPWPFKYQILVAPGGLGGQQDHGAGREAQRQQSSGS